LSDDDLQEVRQSYRDRILDWIRAGAAGREEGVFGSTSAIWQVDREAAVFLGAGRALLMQLAHPWVATAIAEHSSAMADPIRRFHRTFEIVFALVFGSLDQALATARRLHRRHAAIRGRLPEPLARYGAGSPYYANEVSALMWVHATLVDTAVRAYELVLPELPPDFREHYYADCRRLGALFGIPVEAQPADWQEFASYVETTIASDQLEVSAAARSIAAGVLAGAGRIPVPRWYRDLTTTLLPQELRLGYRLPFGHAEEQRAKRAVRVLRRVYPWIPSRLRSVPPYFEARGRLSGRSRPDLVTRSLNRLWIGRPSLPS
jgi:uncharacterized protein (DUF2236 family)